MLFELQRDMFPTMCPFNIVPRAPRDLRESFGLVEELRDLARELGRILGIGDEEPGLVLVDKLHQPPRRAASTGVPAAMASIATMPNGS